MRGLAVVLGLTLAGGAAADGFRALTGDEITQVLTGAVLVFGEARQSFSAGGATIYDAGGNPQPGRWTVDGDRYCSQWPPGESWACYDVLQDGAVIRFVGDGGRAEDGVLQP